MNILIIEDEFNLADAIASMLKSQKYLVNICTDGITGEDEALTGMYDLIILDVMLPHKNGFDILKNIKLNKIKSKIIMLTAKSNISDKLEGFNDGANDYLTKPFHMEELLARVNVQLRRNDNGTNLIEYGDISLNLEKLILKNNKTNDEINIIGKEFNLLELLINNSNNIISKEQIFNKIWGYDSDSDINSLEVYMSFLRKKLKLINSKVKIKVIRNMGYKLELQNEKIKI